MQRLLKQDIIITICTSILLIFGAVAVYSTTLPFAADVQQSFPKHLIYIAVGVLCYLLIMLIKLDWLKNPLVLLAIYFLTIASLVYLVVFGEVIAGTKRWINFGAINIQPAEIAKLVIILVTAVIWGYREHLTIKSIKKLGQKQAQNGYLALRMMLAAISFVPIVVLVYGQKSLGNTLILSAIWGILILARLQPGVNTLFVLASFILGALNLWFLLPVLLFLKRTSRIILVTMAIFGIIGFGIHFGAEFAWNNLVDDYQKTRITSFLNPGSDPQGSGWQVARAQIAIAASPVPFGFGLLQGPQTSSTFLPFPYTDFIFASIVEQFGLFGATLILIIYVILLTRIIWVGLSRTNFAEQLISLGIAAMIFLNLVVHVGMNIGVLPVTGVPLPLISYGGSSLIVVMIGLGIMQLIVVSQEIGNPSHSRKLTRLSKRPFSS